jgi:hypothetical protein
VNVIVLSGDEFRSNGELHEEIIRLASPTYEDPSALLIPAIIQFDTAYLARDDDGRLLSFFMHGYDEIVLSDRVLPAIHLGWTCATQDTKGSHLVRALYEQFLQDARAVQDNQEVDFTLWGTTATPVGFHLYHKYFVDVVPDNQGGYSDEALEIANAIRMRLTGEETVTKHPFLLSGVSKARFSQQELDRVANIGNNKTFTLFDDLGISERNGDRLLVICRLPE